MFFFSFLSLFFVMRSRRFGQGQLRQPDAKGRTTITITCRAVYKELQDLASRSLGWETPTVCSHTPCNELHSFLVGYLK